jgi:hypothetical protein
MLEYVIFSKSGSNPLSTAADMLCRGVLDFVPKIRENAHSEKIRETICSIDDTNLIMMLLALARCCGRPLLTPPNLPDVTAEMMVAAAREETGAPV